MRHSSLLALIGACLVSTGCKEPAEEGTPPGGGGDGSTTGACPLSLTDGMTYNAVSCDVSGSESFAAGVYQIQIAARFNTSQPIRSVNFTLNDHDDASETHIKTFAVGTERPSVNASYAVTFQDKWNTLEQTNVVGSGSFVVTEYDRGGKLISGTYDIVVKQGAASRTITGVLTHVPMKQAD